MEIIKTDVTLELNNQDAEIVAEVKKLIAKINNLLWHRYEPDYLLDLMGDDLIARHGRERLKEVAGPMLTDPVEAPELSKKFTKLWYPLLERFFYPHDFPYRVEVRYELDRHDFNKRYDDRGIFAVPASSEPVIVERLLGKMSSCREEVRVYNADLHEANLLFLAGAPDSQPSMRNLSAEEYIAKASREPMTAEEHDRMMREDNRKADLEVNN
jgi:hypothetical protein